MEQEIKTFEMQLLGWKKSTSKKGPTITFQLQDDEDMEYFEAFTVSKGKTAGQIFDIAVKISDQDDQSKEPKPDKPKPKPELKGGNFSRDAAILCKEPNFQRFLIVDFYAGTPFESLDYMSADVLLKNICKIASKKELDHNEEAATRFRKLHKRYSEWLNKEV